MSCANLTDFTSDKENRFCMGKIGQNLKVGQLWRPVAAQPYVVQKSWADCGNSLALGLQCGVNSISLQCILWPSLSEVPVWPTFDFRFSGSGIRTMIQIGLKSRSVRPCLDTCRYAKFHPNRCTCFWVILLTDRQTSRAIAFTSSFVVRNNANWSVDFQSVGNQQRAALLFWATGGLAGFLPGKHWLPLLQRHILHLWLCYMTLVEVLYSVFVQLHKPE